MAGISARGRFAPLAAVDHGGGGSHWRRGRARRCCLGGPSHWQASPKPITKGRDIDELEAGNSARCSSRSKARTNSLPRSGSALMNWTDEHEYTAAAVGGCPPLSIPPGRPVDPDVTRSAPGTIDEIARLDRRPRSSLSLHLSTRSPWAPSLASISTTPEPSSSGSCSRSGTRARCCSSSAPAGPSSRYAEPFIIRTPGPLVVLVAPVTFVDVCPGGSPVAASNRQAAPRRPAVA